jgi:hypothetical protein
LKKTSAANDASSGDGLREQHEGSRRGIAKWITDRRVPIGVALIGVLLCLGLIWMLWPSTPKPPPSIRANRVPPTIRSLHPSSMTAGKGAFTLTIIGEGFVSGAKVRWEGLPLESTYIDPTTIKAEIPRAFIAQPGTAYVIVRTPIGTSTESRFIIAANTAQNHRR